ncbi:hypothetical protein [Streptomyces sp. NPDC046685]|uniref:hypothetical protein n=1 Tax=Streptomyces sp. NPDC046685 TaxID=3157202 RepID=UPI0033F545C9
MNTHRVNAAAGVLHAAMEQGKTLPQTLAYALESAQLLQSPETAAELSRLRALQNARPAELSEAQIDALADAGNRALNDHYHDDLCHCSDWPESCASSGNYFAGSWDTAAFDIGMAAVIGLWESMRAPAEADELSRLRDRVAELEAERTRQACDQCGTPPQEWCERCASCPAGCHGGSPKGEPCLIQPASAWHEGPEPHTYRLGRDLPEMPHA